MTKRFMYPPGRVVQRQRHVPRSDSPFAGSAPKLHAVSVRACFVALSLSVPAVAQPAAHALPQQETGGGERNAAREFEFWVPSLHAVGLLTVMRSTEAVVWPEPFADFRPRVMARGYRQAFTRPPKWDGSRSAFEWDGDNWYLNSVGHGLLGSELYLRARMCRWGPGSALLFTAGASAVWEYGFEASHVRPSALDLVYTPAAGIIFGEFRYQLWHMSRGIDDSAWRGVVQFVIDPLGSLERLAGTPC